MRIAYLVNRYPWPSHTFIRREIEALERLGVTVLRFSIRPTDPHHDVVDPDDRRECDRTRALLAGGANALAAALFRTLLRRPGVFLLALRTALAIGFRSDRGLLRHIVYLAEACLLCEWLRDSEIDHLHAHFATNPAAVAMLCRRLGGPPYSFTIHGPEPFDKPTLLALGRKVAHASFVAAISDYARSQLCRWCDREHWRKIHVVRCGIDERFLEAPERIHRGESGESDLSLASAHSAVNSQRFVCIARLSEQKGLFVLIDAARMLAQREIEFEIVLVGDGPLRRELEQAINDADLHQRIKLTGWATADEVRQHLLDARALILPSFAEGLPIVIMEAMALGRPVICTAVGGIPELVVPGVHGWLIPPGNADELAKAVEEAIGLPPQRLAEMGRAGAAAVKERHDVANQAAALKALFARQR